MPEHYFTASPTSPHAQRAVTLTALGVKMRLVTDAGVFSREGLDAGTRILLEALPPLAGRVLDLGCGWGALGLTLAKRYPEAQFVLTDLNERACQLSKRNAEANALQNVRVLCGDGFEPVQGAFDWICTNPPIRAGKRVIYALFARAAEHLLPGGRLAIVMRKQQGAASALRFLEENYACVQTLDKSAGYWVLCASEPARS